MKMAGRWGGRESPHKAQDGGPGSGPQSGGMGKGESNFLKAHGHNPAAAPKSDPRFQGTHKPSDDFYMVPGPTGPKKQYI
jgi:hypothetical protein